MTVENHPLAKEFPIYKDTIRTLKLSDAHFVKIYDEYDATDRAITRVENGVDFLGDVALETLKKVRITLKDQAFEILKKTAGH